MSNLGRAAFLAVASSFAVAAPLAALPGIASAQTIVAAVTVAPPPLPVYAQPAIPAPGYIWVPGYWAWRVGGYYWVPGAWVFPPAIGLLWTPGYWAWSNGEYLWHIGYWGRHVGFYGGINYGFGYDGVGYVGGHWDHGRFFYNRAVNNLGRVHITNVYNHSVRTVADQRVSFNGGNGGTHAHATAEEFAAAHEHHFGPTPLQVQHERTASANRALLASVNHARPPIAAARHAVSAGHGSVGARLEQRPRPVQMAKAGGAPVHRPAPHPHPNPNAHPVHVAKAGPRPAHQSAPHPQPHPQPHPVHVAQAGGGQEREHGQR